MFQYAFGRQLARQLNADLVFDPTNLLYRNNPPDFVYRNYDLDVFRPRYTRFRSAGRGPGGNHLRRLVAEP